MASWLTVLKNDKKAIFTAASHAQKAVDFLQSLQPDPEPDPEQQPETDPPAPAPEPERAPPIGSAPAAVAEDAPASGPPVPDGPPSGKPGQLSFF